MKNSDELFKIYGDLSQHQLDAAFKYHSENGELEIVKYLLTSPDLKNNANIHAGDDAALSSACLKGRLDVVEYLLTSPNLKEHANLEAYGSRPFVWACIGKQFAVVDYLMNSPDLKQHPTKEAISKGFIAVFDNSSQLDMVRHLIVDANIEMTNSIKLHLWTNRESSKYAEVKSMFDTRDFNNQLQEELGTNKPTSSKRNKL